MQIAAAGHRLPVDLQTEPLGRARQLRLHEQTALPRGKFAPRDCLLCAVSYEPNGWHVAQGAATRQEPHRFNEIGLAAPVLAGEQRQPGMKLEF